MQNSWYVKEDGQHHFFCKCGKHDVLDDDFSEKSNDFKMIDFKRDEISLNQNPNFYYPDNCCEVCNNEKYLDLKALLYEDKIKYWSNFQREYQEKINTDGWYVGAFVEIPKLDKKTKIFMTEYIELASYKIDREGQGFYFKINDSFFKKSILVDKRYWRLERVLKDTINKKIFNLILKTPSRDIEWLNEEEVTLEELSFFLKNPNIRSIDMLSWKNREQFIEAMNQYQYVERFLVHTLNNRKEKSLRKSVFNSYVKMMESKEYNPMTDYIFSRTISDVNHLNKVLNIDIEVKKRLFNGCRIEDINHFIDFLKSFYSEKYIVQLWLSIGIDDLQHYLVRDTINLFNNREMREELNKKFQKTPLNLRVMHHELTRYSRRLERLGMKNKRFSYSDIMIASKVSREGISYKLPLDFEELYDWGSILHNCLFSYKYTILNGQKTIFGLFVNEKLTYAVEIFNNTMVQLSASHNQTLPKEEIEKVDRWYNEVYIKNLKKLFR